TYTRRRNIGEISSRDSNDRGQAPACKVARAYRERRAHSRRLRRNAGPDPRMAVCRRQLQAARQPRGSSGWSAFHRRRATLRRVAVNLPAHTPTLRSLWNLHLERRALQSGRFHDRNTQSGARMNKRWVIGGVVVAVLAGGGGVALMGAGKGGAAQAQAKPED